MIEIVLDGSCTLSSQLDGSCALRSTMDGIMDKVVEIQRVDYYTGDYTVTPSSEAITLNTAQLMMNGNVTVEPIPSNYGLVTWNGSTLTVS